MVQPSFLSPGKLIAAALLAVTSTVHAQEIPSTPEIGPWGIRAELIGTSAYSELLSTVGATYTLNRHQFTAGLLVAPVRPAFTHSPLYGSAIGYQYFPFRTRKHFNPYFFSANTIGRSTSQYKSALFNTEYVLERGVRTDVEFVTTTMAGIGAEFRFGNHFYGNASIGAGIYTRRYETTFEYTEKPGQQPLVHTSRSTQFGIEGKIGAGYRF